uniref:Reverse transcriptase zinc-binding domain-containing protein n=1 Tax=Cannabis sativa TaxID=3483 RepID=A0A803QB28_CANSA
MCLSGCCATRRCRVELRRPPILSTQAQLILANSWLPTNSALAHRKVAIDPTCQRCSKGVSATIFHALWGCKANKGVWKISGFKAETQRNNTKHGGRVPQAAKVVDWSVQYLMEFWGPRSEGNNCDRRQKARWVQSPQSKMKLNVDAGVKQGGERSSLSCVIRDGGGSVLLLLLQFCQRSTHRSMWSYWPFKMACKLVYKGVYNDLVLNLIAKKPSI